MAEGYTVTSKVFKNGDVRVDVVWTSAADGTCSIPFDADNNAAAHADMMDKFLKLMRTNPSATAPTADYDIVINDEDSVDILGGAGADRHTSTTEEVHPVANSIKWARLIEGDLDIEITNAGDTKIGTISLYLSDDRTML